MGQDPNHPCPELVYYKTMALTTEKNKTEGTRIMVAEERAPRLAINIPFGGSVNS